MKNKIYRVYALLFNIFSIFPLKLNKVTFLSPHNENFNDSLGAVMEEVIRRDEHRIIKISSSDLGTDKKSVSAFFKSIGRIIKFMTVQVYHLATSKYVFLNDNFMPLGMLKFNENAVITQLWHAEGIFKKFGLDIEQPQEIRELEIAGNKKLSYVVCSSEDVRTYYADAFGVDEEKVLALGAPRMDYFKKKINEDRLKADFCKKYPQCRGKKMILYAPTFRDNTDDDRALLESIDIKAFNDRFGEEYILLVRLHPQVHNAEVDISGAVDVCNYPDVIELSRLCDILITDYSSICMDFAVQEKPIYFYAFDLEKYDSERSFYIPYESYVPGPVAKDFTTLLNLINSNVAQSYNNKLLNFNHFNFGENDGNSAKRVADTVIT